MVASTKVLLFGTYKIGPPTGDTCIVMSTTSYAASTCFMVSLCSSINMAEMKVVCESVQIPQN